MVYTIGDIHGNFKALMQCLERSSFNYRIDALIVLGDVVDGWYQVPQCIEELLKIDKLIYIWGNHDTWCNKWFKTGWSQPVWTTQGGDATKEAYIKQPELMAKHRHFFDIAKPYYIYKNKLFVHGGLYPINKPIEKQELFDLTWDRDLLKAARYKHYQKPDYKYAGFDEIFIGHTETTGVQDTKPLHYCNVRALDQGCGWAGKLTMMNVNTHEYWQSDNVLELYPNIGRRR